MATDVERLIIQLEAQSVKLDKALDAAARAVDGSMDRIERRTTQMSKIMEGVFYSIGATLLSVFSVRGLIRFGEEVIASTAKLTEQSQQLQVGVEAMQAYRIAFQEAGSSSETADRAIDQINRHLGDAANGSKEARQFFQALGVSFQDLQKASPDERLSLVARRLLAVSDGASRTALEIRLVGRSGREIESTLGTLAQGVDVLIDKYKEQGRIVTEELAKKTDIAVDRMVAAFDRMKTASVPAFAAIAEGIATLLTNLAGLPASIETLEASLIAARSVAERNAGTGAGRAAEARVKQLEADIARQRRAAAQAAGIPFAPPKTGDVKAQINEYDQLLAKMKLASELAGKTTDEREVDQRLLQLATAKVAEQGRANLVLFDSMKAVTAELSAQEVSKVRQIKSDEDMNTLMRERRELTATRGFNAAHPQGLPEKDILDDTRKQVEKSIDAGADLVKIQTTREFQQQRIYDDMVAEIALARMMPAVREQELEVLRLKERFGDEFIAANEEEIRTLVRLKQHAEELGRFKEMAADTFADLGTQALTGAKSIKAAFSDLIVTLAQYIIKLQLAKFAQTALGGAGGGGGGVLGSIGTILGAVFGGGGGVSAGGFDMIDSQLPGRALGGSVMRGRAYKVGEDGEETFIPGQNGYVMPHLGNMPSLSQSSVHVMVTASREFETKVIAIADDRAKQQVSIYDRHTLPTRVNNIVAEHPTVR